MPWHAEVKQFPSKPQVRDTELQVTVVSSIQKTGKGEWGSGSICTRLSLVEGTLALVCTNHMADINPMWLGTYREAHEQ